MPGEGAVTITTLDGTVVAFVPVSPLSIGEDGHAVDYRVSAIPAGEREAFRTQLAEELAGLARAKLPKGQRFEIRAAPPRDYGRHQTMAWYTNAVMQTEPLWAPCDIVGAAPYVSEWGYHLLARQVV